MLSESKATQTKAGPVADAGPHFLIEPEPWLRIFLRNLADSFRRQLPPVGASSKPGEYWADALVDRPAAWASIADSFLGHVLIVAGIISLTVLWLNQPRVVPDEMTQSRRLENYEVSEYLPPVNRQKPQPPRRKIAQKPDPAYAPQEIISIHVDYQSTRQTIVNPINPRLLSQDVPLPNIVVWTPVLAMAPVASNHSIRQLPLTIPPVVPPVEQPAERKLNALEFPVQPQVVAPTEAPAKRNVAALNLPATPQAAVPPSQTAAQRQLGDIDLAMSAPSIEAPQLPVPEQKAASGQESGQTAQVQPQASIPRAEPVTQGTGKSQAREMGQLLVANLQPAAPIEPVRVPEGNRQGEFAAGPSGRPGASGQPEIAAGGNDSSVGGKDGVNSLPSSVYIAPPPAKITAAVVVSAPAPPPPAPAPRPDIHSAGTAHSGPPPERIDNQVFGDRKSYAMALNMPNLTSAVGSSWIIRFAEMNPGPGSGSDGLSAPVPVSKVDPAYPATLMRDRVEGTVILYAVIHSDGSVGDIKVLQGVDDTLDENARNALQKWHFRPGTKNGAPVDLEAVIRIPFRVPRKVF